MRFLVLPLCGLVVLCGLSNAGDTMPDQTYSAMKQKLLETVDIVDATERGAALDRLWEALHTQHRLPFVAGESVAFLWRGEATSVSFTGDFNGWSPSAARAVRLGTSDVWLQEEIFPVDSRLDYKVVIDGDRWILDPENRRRQRSGFGDNSELRMPGYVESPCVTRRDGVAGGELAPGSFVSASLGYTVGYQVYTPAGYDAFADLPVIYVTDGHEYADDMMGSMVLALDNLIADGLIRPMMAVFIDPRVDGHNLRAQQYVLNERFVNFVARELVPAIDGAWKTSRDRRDRGILGTSLGGLNSAWFALRASDVFHRIGIQSPAFHAGDGTIVGLFRESPPLDVDIFMTWGTFNDFDETTMRFKAILDVKGYDYRQITVNEGHSWGNWRALLDDILIAFWPAAAD